MTLPLPIETDRLTLRRYLETDYDDLLKLQSNDDVTRFLLYDTKTPEQVRTSPCAGRLADVPMDTDGQALTLAVILRETGQHVGEVTLFVQNAEHRGGEIGFVFHRSSTGAGTPRRPRSRSCGSASRSSGCTGSSAGWTRATPARRTC